MATEVKRLVIELAAQDVDLIESVARHRLRKRKGGDQAGVLTDYMHWLMERDVSACIQEIERRHQL
jgi:hypothetical protein